MASKERLPTYSRGVVTSTASGLRTIRSLEEDRDRDPLDSSDERAGEGELLDGREVAGFLPPVKKAAIFCQKVGAGAGRLLERRSPEYRPDRPSERFLEPRREPLADDEVW